MEQSWKLNEEAIRQVVQEACVRAQESRFGIQDRELIRTLYLRLESSVNAELPDSEKEMTLFMHQYITLSVIPLGSGAIFNMQGFLENDEVPDQVRELIGKIFLRLDSRDLNFRYGPCPCISCTNPALALIGHMMFLRDEPPSPKVH